MQRSDLVLAVLSTSEGGPWEPVQVQKIFFLLDRKLPRALGGPHFAFDAYDYGPYDKQVYEEINELAAHGDAIVRPGRLRTFALTPRGQSKGEHNLRALPSEVRTYIGDLARWVRSLSFAQLVSAIYREYPEMRQRSVFRE